jgi:hypothetical protein
MEYHVGLEKQGFLGGSKAELRDVCPCTGRPMEPSKLMAGSYIVHPRNVSTWITHPWSDILSCGAGHTAIL